MTGDSPKSTKRGRRLELAMDLLVYLAAVLVGVTDALKGHPELLLLPVAVYVIIALDPRHGRWKNVWE